MRLSDLSRETATPIATLKFYLRESLLPAGEPVNRTQSRYDQSHVERVQLIRALTDSGGLTLARVRAVLTALEEPPQTHELLGVGQAAITPAPPTDADPAWTQVAADFIAGRGWVIDPGDALIVHLGEQLRRMSDAGVGTHEDTLLGRYADAAELIAAADFTTIPAGNAGALRQVVVGTVLTDPVILTLRRLAQQALSAGLPGLESNQRR